MLPLEGTKVLDLTTLSGYCGMELADYGAEVIKVEPPEGDPLRKLEPMKNGASAHHAFRDRGQEERHPGPDPSRRTGSLPEAGHGG